MQLPTKTALRGLSIIAVITFLFPSLLFSQGIVIKEKIAIAPRMNIPKKVNSSSGSIPLLCKSDWFFWIQTTRPCHISATGNVNYEWAGSGKSYGGVWIIGEDGKPNYLYTIWGETPNSTPANFNVGGFYSLWVQAYHGGGQGYWDLEGLLSGNSATFGDDQSASATVTASPLPEYEPSSFIMNANPTCLDANDDGNHEANISSQLLNGFGDPFGVYLCAGLSLSKTYNIENPLGGMTLRETASDGTSTEGTSIEVPLSQNVVFVWDGGDIPGDTYNVSIRAEAYGVSAVQTIQMKKDIHPSVQITSPSEDITVLVTERHQPVITLEETHTPRIGAFIPTITWDPSKAIDTKDFYEQSQDSTSLTVRVTAKNSVGEATDTRIITLKKVEDVDHFNITITPDSIFSDGYAQLSAVALDKYGKETELDDNTVINISASPDNIYYWSEVQYSSLKSGDIYLYPGELPTCIQDFIFTVSSDGASGTGKLVVKSPPCMVMSVSSKKIHPGEKVGITMKKLDCFGKLTSYPADQLFSIWMNTDDKYGKLHCIQTGDKWWYLEGQQPFEFIAAESLDVDSTNVEIQASVSSGGVGVGSIGIGINDTLHAPGQIIVNKMTTARNINVVQNEMKRKGLEFTINKLQAQLTKESAKKDNEKQKQKLAINLEQLKARLVYDTAKTPAGKRKAIASMKQAAILTSETVECKPTAKITIKKGCPEPTDGCSPEQLEPQIFSFADNIKIFRQLENFKGIDPGGTLFSVLVEGCSYNPKKKDISDRGGFTILMPSIPLQPKPGQLKYFPCMDNTYSLSMCFDRDNKRWVPHINDLFLPIFSSACTNSKFITFNGDATDLGSLESQIPEKKIYEAILDDLDYYIIGYYKQKNAYNLHKPIYIFDVGNMTHEDWHVFLISQLLQDYFNKAFEDILQKDIVKYENFPCPEDARVELQKNVREKLWNAYYVTQAERYRIHQDGGQEDLDADKWASVIYTRIKERIVAWGETKGWN